VTILAVASAMVGVVWVLARSKSRVDARGVLADYLLEEPPEEPKPATQADELSESEPDVRVMAALDDPEHEQNVVGSIPCDFVILFRTVWRAVRLVLPFFLRHFTIK
jgi:hypothetical protein